MSTIAQSVTLHGEHVLLQPLAADHADELSVAASDGRLWELHWAHVPSPQSMGEWLRNRLAVGAVA